MTGDAVVGDTETALFVRTHGAVGRSMKNRHCRFGPLLSPFWLGPRHMRGPARLLPVVLLLLPARSAGAPPTPLAMAMAWCHTLRAQGAAFASLPVSAPGSGALPAACTMYAQRTSQRTVYMRPLPLTLGALPHSSRHWMRPHPVPACAGLRSQAGDGDGAALEDPRAHNKPIRVSSWTEGDKGQADVLKSGAICI